MVHAPKLCLWAVVSASVVSGALVVSGAVFVCGAAVVCGAVSACGAEVVSGTASVSCAAVSAFAYDRNGRTYKSMVLLGDSIGAGFSLPDYERYGQYYIYGSPDDYEPYVLGDDEYFACGDNFNNSYDSRYWGPVPGSKLRGVGSVVFWPFNGWRIIR